MFRMKHVGEALAFQPVLVQRVLMRLAQRRPQQAGILRLAPRHVGIGPGADEALHHVQHMRARLVAGLRAGHLTRLQVGIRRRRLQIRLHAVFRQQRHQVLQIARTHAVRDEPAPVLGMADARRMVRRLRRVPVGHPPDRHAPHHPVHDVELGVLRHRLVHRHRHVLPLAGAMAMDQRRDDAGGKLLAGDVIGVPDLRRDRRRVVFQVRIGIVAAVHHDPAQRQMDQIGALEILPRPVIAERRHARGHQRREARVQRGAIQPQRRVQRAAACVQQHVGAFQQTQHVLARRCLAQIQHHRLLVAIVVPEEQRAFQPRLILQERPDPPRRVALRRFDLHHLGAEPGEQQSGVFGAFVGHLDHPQPRQHAWAGVAHHLAGPRAISPASDIRAFSRYGRVRCSISSSIALNCSGAS